MAAIFKIATTETHSKQLTFLILPQIHVPNLASRILSLNLKRLSQDWTKVYGHPIWLVETFVDPRFLKASAIRPQDGFFRTFNRFCQIITRLSSAQ
ncbi:MAG: DUF4338 domain-containing protein [Candidatus Kuenenia sp.]|uniref:Druantia anti-phage system protein DruA n=1 Tax=Candidatus Kuenenia sp. TaxID=2499824 RepID=UPI0022C2D17B|nr:Druantia anti-phage system protein DruA [Candidatus Kuenenia sp.]MCZ7622506.1 DUF4338 domain-containing protein [Candidatus Kuenenia sp.]